ncbi:hypothetical protein CC117_11995 [Parafrankia colletiae]|uniref:Fructose-2,6-bisphosphatase n=1 Tax=Parafrankia colletiae TaxID=573497 RepID=A0A1S1R610_9ACTN|nr:histidine phosphatase family protein [Parafrankia colletiae]MCK9900756.1 histidine phosphatase family protein [Frankia sp. Cpl3]OHV42418.1 hypothetical protein CC117_11995 [Parafrankia colletiae]
MGSVRHGLGELTVVRHGRSTANAALAAAEAAGAMDTAITGLDVDVPLSELGRVRAAALGGHLAGRYLEERHRTERRGPTPGPALDPGRGQPPQVVICSPFLRARQTWQVAAAAARDGGLVLPEPVVDARLGDRAMGRLQLLTSAAVARRFPDEAGRRRRAGEFHYRPPGGESFADVAVRLAAFLDDWGRRAAGGRVFLVAHDAVVLLLRYVLEKLTVDDVAAIVAAGPVINAAVTRFVRDGDRLVLAEYNTATWASHRIYK